MMARDEMREEWAGEELLHHIRTMYPGVWDAMGESSKRSIRNFVNNGFEHNSKEKFASGQQSMRKRAVEATKVLPKKLPTVPIVTECFQMIQFEIAQAIENLEIEEG